MKKFIVDTGNKKYKVEANTYDEAISAVKAIQLKDEASPLQTVNALLEDERAAVDAYNVALENLKGKIPDESYAAIEAIRDDENHHIENLQAVVNGTVTEKNLEDSKITLSEVKDADVSKSALINLAHEISKKFHTKANALPEDKCIECPYVWGKETLDKEITSFLKSKGYTVMFNGIDDAGMYNLS